jgi:hypothetical protein
LRRVTQDAPGSSEHGRSGLVVDSPERCMIALGNVGQQNLEAAPGGRAAPGLPSSIRLSAAPYVAPAAGRLIA